MFTASLTLSVDGLKRHHLSVHALVVILSEANGSAFMGACCRNDPFASLRTGSLILRLRLRMTILARSALHFVNELVNTYNFCERLKFGRTTDFRPEDVQAIHIRLKKL